MGTVTAALVFNRKPTHITSRESRDFALLLTVTEQRCVDSGITPLRTDISRSAAVWRSSDGSRSPRDREVADADRVTMILWTHLGPRGKRKQPIALLLN